MMREPRIGADASTAATLSPAPAFFQRPAPEKSRLTGIVTISLLLGMQLLPPIAGLAGMEALATKERTGALPADGPPIRFAPGADLAAARVLGLAGAFAVGDGGGSFHVELHGVAGGRVTIDNITHIRREASVMSYKMQVASSGAGDLDGTVLRARFYEGTIAPARDDDPQVCAVLDLRAPANAETNTACSADDVFLQFVCELPASSGKTVGGSVGFRPSSVKLA